MWIAGEAPVTTPWTNHGQIWNTSAEPQSTLTCQTLPGSVYSVASKRQKKLILLHFRIQYPMVPPSSVETTAIPAQPEKNTGHFARHLIKNTGHLTGLQKPISLYLLGIIVSRQYSKSSDVGIYQARMLLPEIIVILLTQKCTFRTVMYVSYVFMSIPHSATVDRNQLV